MGVIDMMQPTKQPPQPQAPAQRLPYLSPNGGLGMNDPGFGAQPPAPPPQGMGQPMVGRQAPAGGPPGMGGQIPPGLMQRMAMIKALRSNHGF